LPQGTFKAVALEGLGCAQSVAGDIACFLQPGTLADTSIAPTGKFGSFDVGISSMCALDSSGTVTCKETPGPQLLQGAPAGVKFSQVSVGDLFACAIRADNSELVCWGAAGDDGACAASPKTGQLDAPSGAFMQVSSTLFHSCAVRMDHTVACWGSGDATDDPNQILCNDKLNYGQSVAPAGSFVQVSAGSLHSCGVHTDGTVACWGAGTKQGDCANDVDACGQSIPATGSFVQVAAGYTHSCGMRADRSVQCWGSNTGGRSTPPADFP
jgi:alpha-tubulin suppressor-like RCC1 family protein